MTQESIERFRRGFWNKQTPDRPPVGIVPDRVWSPIGFLRQRFPRDYLAAADVTAALVRNEYEDAFSRRPVTSDDFMPYVAAWRAIPWLEAMCGCRVHRAAGSLAPEPCLASLRQAAIPAAPEWMECLRARTAELAASVPEGCRVSTTILRGCADVLAAMRGLSAFCLDLHDDPQAAREAAARVNELHLSVLRMHFAMVGPRDGGYGHIFGYWSPEPTTVIQEDVMGLCAPVVYRELFFEANAELVRRAGGRVLFHLHSTGCRHYRHVLEIPGLAGVEVTVEANGPELSALLPALREILERSRLILMIDGHFDELSGTLRCLPREGLYLLVSDRFIAGEQEFREFAKANW